jgi:predicted ATPase
MKPTKWIVLSGTTSSGKTTISQLFDRLGFPTVPDLTRVYIDTLFSQGNTIEQIRNDKSTFFNTVHQFRLWFEDKLSRYTHVPIVFDRAAPETIAYARVDGFDENNFWDTVKKYRYQTVFMPQPLAFVPDGMRTNDPERRLQVFDELKDVYTRLGYDIIEIPVLPIEKREVFVQQHLKVMEIKPTKQANETKAYIEGLMEEYIKKVCEIAGQ